MVIIPCMCVLGHVCVPVHERNMCTWDVQLLFTPLHVAVVGHLSKRELFIFSLLCIGHQCISIICALTTAHI